MSFRCRRCGSCCRWHGYVRLSAGEIDSIAAFLGLASGRFIEQYTCLTADRRSLSLTESTDGSCVFLEQNPCGCRIEAVKPAQCRSFPEKWNFPGWERECAGTKETS